VQLPACLPACMPACLSREGPSSPTSPLPADALALHPSVPSQQRGCGGCPLHGEPAGSLQSTADPAYLLCLMPELPPLLPPLLLSTPLPHRSGCPSYNMRRHNSAAARSPCHHPFQTHMGRAGRKAAESGESGKPHAASIYAVADATSLHKVSRRQGQVRSHPWVAHGR